MDFLQFLNILENTLQEISIRGRADLQRMGGIYSAIDQMRMTLIKPEGGEEDGRQSDTGA